MKNLITLLLVSSFCFQYSGAQTFIADSTEVSGTWSKANSPYVIEGELIVPTGSTLIIEPGVVVKFKTGTEYDYTANIDVGYFNIYGKVLAIGTAEDSILFTRDGSEGNWGILFFREGSDSSIFEYSIFEYANNVDGISDNSYYNYYSGAISLFRSKASVQNCNFRLCNGYGLFSNM